MRSTMMDVPLTVTSIMRYGTTAFGDKNVVTNTGDGSRRQTYADLARRAARLANALRRLGVDGDQRVATFMWNNAEHLEAYLAVPSMGAVLHTLNIRLAPAQIGYIATHAEDAAVIVDASLVPLLAEVLPHAKTSATARRSPPSTCVTTWPPACPAGSYPSAGRTSTRYRKQASASSPSARCGRHTPTASTKSSRLVDDRRTGYS